MKIGPRIWLAPTGGEAACAPLVAAVAEAGGFGWLGGAYLAPPALPERFEEDFEAQVAVLRVPVIGFTFSDPGAARVAALHADGAQVVGTATNVPEALQLQASGCDAVIARGAEAGAHRGSFIGPRDAGLAGTASLLADECTVSAAYRAALEAGAAHDTVLTQAFSGRWARGLPNRFTRETDALVQRGDLPGFPVPNALTRPLRRASAQAGSADDLSLWAGQALPLARRAPAAEIVRRFSAGWRP